MKSFLKKLLAFCLVSQLAFGSSVLLNWNAPSPAPNPAITKYKIYKGTCGHEVFLTQVNVPTTTYTDAAVANSQTYCYYVTDVNVNGESKASNEVSVTMPSVVAAPTSLTFARQLVGSTSASQDVVITNTTGSTVTIQDDALGGQGISVSRGTIPYSLTAAGNASGGSTIYTGDFTGGPVLPSGAANALAGTVFEITGFDNSANNGVFRASASSTTTVTLANASGVSDTHAGLARPTGDFAQTNTLGTLPHTLANNATFTVHVFFSPTSGSTRNGSLTVNSSDGSFVAVPLTGLGSAPIPDLPVGLQTDDVTTPNQTRIQEINSAWVNGVAPGYKPGNCGGLTLCVGSGLMADGTGGTTITMRNYTGASLTMSDNTTNYVYLNHSASFVPAKNTTGYLCNDFPIAKVTTLSGAITAIEDDRTIFVYNCHP